MEGSEGRDQGLCEVAASSIRSPSSEMSDRPWSNSEMESRDGGMDESEEDEEKERGNMKIDWWIAIEGDKKAVKMEEKERKEMKNRPGEEM